MMAWPWCRPVETTAMGRCRAERAETYFQLHVSVKWRRRRDQNLQAGEFMETILKTAQWVCGQFSVLDAPRVHQALDEELRRTLSTEVNVRNVAVWVAPEQQSVAHAIRLEEEARRKLELEYLRDHILRSPTLAALWYMNGERSRLFELIDEDKPFEKAISIATGSLNTDDRAQILDLVKHARKNTTPQLWNLVFSQLSDLLAELGQVELKEGIASFISDNASGVDSQ